MQQKKIQRNTTYRDTLLMAMFRVYRNENMSMTMFSRSPSCVGVKYPRWAMVSAPTPEHRVWMPVSVQGKEKWNVLRMALL